MKSKRLTAILMAVVAAIIAFSAFTPESEYYEKYKAYKYAFFPDYSSLNHSLSDSDREKAEDVLSKAREAFTCFEEDEPFDMGELKKYRNTDPEVKSAKVEIEAVAGDFTFKNGYLWVIYSLERFDEAGKSHSRSSDVLALWKLKNENGVWTVTKIKENL